MANSKLSNLTQAQIEQLAEQALERSPLARISLWPNRKRREGKNDSHFTGKLQLNTVQLAEVLAEALANGEETVECWFDMWHNDNPGVGKSGGERPTLSGRARNFVEQQEGDAASESIVNRLRESLHSG